MRIPPWLRVKLPADRRFCGTGRLLADLKLGTVCQSARCPNIFECFSGGVATFLVMGPSCTRACAFCNIRGGAPAALDPDEPRRLAEGARRLGLAHVVITSVTRDDLPDGGAGHFRACLDVLRAELPGLSTELLIPDFQGDPAALATVLEGRPDVLNHNLETAPGLYARIRPQADYGQSLTLLARAARAGATTKSGLMVGLGETDDEVRAVLADLAGVGCRIVTIGQYMRPSLAHPPVARYVEPATFEAYAAHGRSLGLPEVFSAPLVRSSYRAAEVRGREAGVTS